MGNGIEIEGLSVLTSAQMYRADAAAVEGGVESLYLMESAGFQVAREIRARWPRQRLVVLCGPGNNGGDGFVVARLMRKAGWPVRVGLLGQVDVLQGDAATNAERWLSVGGHIEGISPDSLAWAGLAVDALFGAGLSRPLDGTALNAIQSLKTYGIPCIAIDVPSGVSGDTGLVLGGEAALAPQCALTVTFFRPKPAHVLLPGRDLCGELIVADIGIPGAVLEAIKPDLAVNGPEQWSIPSPTAVGHKYARGHAVVFGSQAMSGAARLAAGAARAVGAGLLTIAAPEGARPEYLADAAGLMFEDTSKHTAAEILQDTRRNAVLIGPGYGVGQATRGQVLEVLDANRSTTLDADALTSFADRPEYLFTAIGASSGDVVLTPHGGEFAALFGDLGVPDKLSRARLAAKRSGAAVVLKGSDTVIAAPDGRASISVNGPPWLATAGSGDVLAGLICGLMAQGLNAWEAACAGVWVHGEAGHSAGPGLIAEGLLEAIPAVLAKT